MRLTLGERSHDLTAASLVMAVVDAGAANASEVPRLGERLVAEGADVLEVTGPSIETVAQAVRALAPLGTAVAVATGHPAMAAAAYEAGAVLGTDPEGAGEAEFFSVSAEAGVSVVVDAPGGGAPGPGGAAPAAGAGSGSGGLDQALAAGIPRDRLVLAADPDHLGEVRRLAGHGLPILLSAPAAGVDEVTRAASLGTIALGVIWGCRMVRTDDVRGARRVCDVLAAIRQAGS